MKANWQRARVTGFGNKTAILALLLAVIVLSLLYPHLLPPAVRADGWVPHSSGTPLDLYGIWGDSSSTVFACGDNGTVLRFDGNDWSSHLTGVQNELYGVWGQSSTDVFVVGDNGTIMHYDGISWSQLSSGTQSHLNAVWGSAPDNVYAAGTGGVVLHYDGASWSDMNSGVTNNLYGLWGDSSTNLFATGNNGSILQYSGTGWTQMSCNTTSTLWGIWGSSSSDIFTVGNSGCILHYDGSSWTQMSSGTYDNLYCVWGTSSSDVFAAGANGLILHYDGITWDQMTTGISHSLRGVWGRSATDVFVAGDSGTVLHYAADPVVISVSPDCASQADNLTVTITGNNFIGPLTISFGDGISIPSYSLDGPTQITANITVSAGATAGPRDVAVTNGYGTGVLSGGFTVQATNQPPVATDDSYVTNEDQPMEIPEPGMLGNDLDPDSDSLVAILATGPSNGTLDLRADGSFRYTPIPDFYGEDSFTYRAYDGTAYSGNATVIMIINPVNDAPTAAQDAFSVEEDEMLSVTAPGILGNDGDTEGNLLTAELHSSTSHGTLNLSSDGSFIYVPHNDFHGTDSFSYRSHDGDAYSNIATVTITVNPVNDAPVAAADSYGVNEDGTLNMPAPGVLANDTDAEGDSLAAWMVSNVSYGTLSLAGDGSFIYIPQPDFHGSDSFTYRVFDGMEYSAPTTVTLNVIPVNDAPVATSDSYSVNEDATLIVAAPGVLGNDSDIDSGSLTAVLNDNPSHGTLTLLEDGSFVYSPDPDFHGTDSFSYHVSDGALQSQAAVVHITVSAMNDAPVARGMSYVTLMGRTLEIPSPGVLENDTDVDGDQLTAVLVSNVSQGSLVLNPDGSFSYTPAAGFSGTDSFSYQAFDGSLHSNQATVTLTVNWFNEAPVAADDVYTIDEDIILPVSRPGVLANDTDPDDNVLSAILVSGPGHGILTLNANGSFTYTPDQDFHGTDSFMYLASDSFVQSEPATVTIIIRSVNDAPNATSDTFAVTEDATLCAGAPGVLKNDSDVDGESLAAVLVNPTVQGTLVLNSDGSFVYSPEANFVGVDSFTYRAYDGSLYSDVVTVTIQVNQAPPVLFTISPSEGIAGQAVQITISGANLSGATAVSLGTGIEFTRYRIESDDLIVADIQIDPAAAGGTRDITVVTSAGTAALPGAFRITLPQPTISILDPPCAPRGLTLDLSIFGNHLLGTTSVSFGQGIAVNSYQVKGAQEITVSISIDSDALPGLRSITVSTPGGRATLPGGFEVTRPAPVLTSLSSGSAQRGQTVEIIINGDNLDQATRIDLGDGITIENFYLDGSSRIVATVNIADDASTGPRDVSVMTPRGTATLPEGFTVGRTSSSVWLWLGIGLIVIMMAFFLVVTRRRPTRKWTLLDLANRHQ